MMELFTSEVEAQAEVLNNALVELEAGSDPAASLEALMRASHSVKGAARIVNLAPAVEVAHAMEDLFVLSQEGKLEVDAGRIDLLLKGVDFLVRISTATPEEVAGFAGEAAGLQASLRTAMQPGDLAVPGAAPAAKPAQTAARMTSPPPAFSEKAETISFELDDLSMIDLFRMELETQMQTLSVDLVKLEENRTDSSIIDSLMRASHSIKGAARIVNLDPAVRVAHALEDCFVAAKEGTLPIEPEQVDWYLAAVDFLGSIRGVEDAELPAWLKSKETAVRELVQVLRSIHKGEKVGSKSPAASPAEAPPAAVAVKAAPVEEVKAARPAAKTTTAEVKDRSVKVTAESLNRLLGLAAESLVEERQLQPMSDAFLRLKQGHNRLALALSQLRNELLSGVDDSRTAPQEAWFQAHQRLEDCRDLLGNQLDAFEGLSRRTTSLSDRLYREVLGSRMRPFSDGTQGFPRLVRDLARALGKKVRFELVGGGTQVDRDILEKLEAPLNHILRNAMDHGIERPSDRAAAGKSEDAKIILEARHSSGMLLVKVRDDGRGIPPEKLRVKVVEKKLVSPEMAEDLTDAELFEFLFLPGFSTAEKVTDLSGRGVGLDVVQEMVHSAGGSVRVFSELGKGTTFQLQLPITRSVVRALQVEICGEPYAFPLARIDGALKRMPEDFKTVEDRLFIEFEGRRAGVVSAGEVLGFPSETPAGKVVHLVLLSERDALYALEVDRFLGERELVVRPLDPRLGKVAEISSAALMEDGSPLLIFDVDDLLKSLDALLAGGNTGRARARLHAANLSQPKNIKRVLVVDDSITVREVERKLLENRGYQVEVAVDGMEGWNAVRLGSYDLVVSDVDMPRMNGIEFVKKIRADSRLKDLPVMIVSYKDREEDRLRGLEAGANFYLTKSSFHDETLIEAVHDLIGAPDGGNH